MAVQGQKPSSRADSTEASVAKDPRDSGYEASSSDANLDDDSSSSSSDERKHVEVGDGDNNAKDDDDDDDDDDDTELISEHAVISPMYVGTIDTDTSAEYVLTDQEVVHAVKEAQQDDTAEEADDEKEDFDGDDDKEQDECEEAYRLRVYGTDGGSPGNNGKRTSSFRRLSEQFSESFSRRHSSIVEQLPETPAGWAVLCSVVASAFVGYEIQLQQSLTAPPLVFGQIPVQSNRKEEPEQTPLHPIYQRLAATPQSILRRNIQPSLFVGRGVAASTAAYLMGGPAQTERHIRFRQIVPMTQDGAQIGLDWELPCNSSHDETRHMTDEQRKEQIQKGPIPMSVVLILHGMNNNASFGYVQSLMRACCDRGWAAAGMNFRGCGGVPLTTPRGYNGAYTGDLRCLVHHITARLGPNAFLFVVGNSLGANKVAKYLGEEGLSGTLPDKVAGCVTLGNPMYINSGNVDYLFSPLLAAGVKRTLLENWRSFWPMMKNDSHFRSRFLKIFRTWTLGGLDNAAAPIMARNDPLYPFGFRVGYKDGRAYWTDASSYRLIRFIPVPTLQIMAADDMLCYNPFQASFSYSLANPNVMIVETRCGGHLGWHESPPPDSSSGKSSLFATSWADVATTDFIQAVLDTKARQQPQQHGKAHSRNGGSVGESGNGGGAHFFQGNTIDGDSSPPIRSRL